MANHHKLLMRIFADGARVYSHSEFITRYNVLDLAERLTIDKLVTEAKFIKSQYVHGRVYFFLAQIPKDPLTERRKLPTRRGTIRRESFERLQEAKKHVESPWSLTLDQINAM